MACGCVLKVDAAAGPDEQPRCIEHNETRVSRVKAGTPRFKGAASGPLAVEDKDTR
jgi:hypothetical protein